MKKYTVDSVEGTTVTLLERGHENNKVIVKDLTFSKEVGDGDLVIVAYNEDGKLKSFEICEEETNQVKIDLENLMSKIQKKSK